MKMCTGTPMLAAFVMIAAAGSSSHAQTFARAAHSSVVTLMAITP